MSKPKVKTLQSIEISSLEAQSSPGSQLPIETQSAALSLFEAVLLDLAGQLSPRSQKTYNYDATHLAGWLQERKLNLHTLTRSDFIEYRRHLAAKYAKSTAGRMLTVARRLLDEAVKRGDLPSNPARDVRGFQSSSDNETPHTALTQPQASQMLTLIDRTTRRGKRDYALLKLFIQTGIRLSELAALQLGDFSREQGHYIVTIRHGKGDKRRVAKIRVDVQRAISQYLEASGRSEAGKSAPLFVPISRMDNPLERVLTARQIERIVTGRAAVIGVELSPHALRATFITLALENGARLQQVQYAAGHSDPRTTERYQKRKLNLDDNAVDFVPL